MKKLILVLFVSVTFINCNKPQINLVPNFDNIGIKITYDSFEYLVNGLCDKVVHNKSLDTIDIINLVRIFNMVHIGDINNNCVKLLYLYIRKRSEFIIYFLNAYYYKGGAFYSKKFDLFLGGQPHYNSQFCIIYD